MMRKREVLLDRTGAYSASLRWQVCVPCRPTTGAFCARTLPRDTQAHPHVGVGARRRIFAEGSMVQCPVSGALYSRGGVKTGL